MMTWKRHERAEIGPLRTPFRQIVVRMINLEEGEGVDYGPNPFQYA